MADDVDTEDLLNQLAQLVEDGENDKTRLSNLQRKGQLETPQQIAGEMIGTVLVGQNDFAAAAVDLMSAHQDEIAGVQAFAYTAVPKAFDVLLKALVDKGLIEQGVAAQVGEAVGAPESESYLSEEDAQMLLDLLTQFRAMVADQSDGQPNTLMGRVDHAIERVKQISTLPEEEDPEADSDDTSETVPAPAAHAEETQQEA